jgi:hypothetical protein
MGQGSVDPFEEFRRTRRLQRDGAVDDAPPPAPPAPAPAPAIEVPEAPGVTAARAAYTALGVVQPQTRAADAPGWPGGAYASIAPRAPERGEILATLGLAMVLPEPFELGLLVATAGQTWAPKILDHYVAVAMTGYLAPKHGVFHGHQLPGPTALDRAILVDWAPSLTIASPRGPAPLVRLLLLEREEVAWAALFGRERLLALMKAHGLLATAPDRRGLFQVLAARPKIHDAQKAAAKEALALAEKQLLEVAPAAIERAVPRTGPGTGWEDAALTAFGDGGIELEVYSPSGVKRVARWRWEGDAEPVLDGKPIHDLAAPAQALATAAGLEAAEPAATKVGRFMRIAYKLTRTGAAKAKGELVTF